MFSPPQTNQSNWIKSEQFEHCTSSDYWLDFLGRNLHLLDVAICGFATIKVACDLCNLRTYPLWILFPSLSPLFPSGNLERNNDVGFTDLEKFCEESLDGKFNKDLFKELSTVSNFQNIKDSIIQFKGKFSETLELWLTYMGYAYLSKMIVFTEQASNWKLHL